MACVFYFLFVFIEFFSLIDKNFPWFELLFRVSVRALNWSTSFITTILFLSFLLFFGDMVIKLEIIALQALKMSFRQLLFTIFKSFLVVSVIWLVVVEVFTPLANKSLHKYLSDNMTKNSAISIDNQWLKSDNSFIRVGKSLGDQLFEINIYEFNEQYQLKKSLKAKQAKWVDNAMRLYDVEQHQFDYMDQSETRVKKKILATYDLDTELNSKIYGYFKLNVESLLLWELWEFIAYVQKNGWDADLFVYNFWNRVVMVVILFSLILIFLPSLLGTPRFSNLGSHLLAGVVIGLLLHALNAILKSSADWFILPTEWLALGLPAFLLAIGSWRCYRYTHIASFN